MEHDNNFRRNATHIDVVLLIPQEEVVHDGGLVQLDQRGHVLHALDAAGVHRAERLPAELGSLEVHHLRPRTSAKTLQGPVCQRRRGDDDVDLGKRRSRNVEELDVIHKNIYTQMSEYVEPMWKNVDSGQTLQRANPLWLLEA